jgi:CheY-like chemotaxis protein
MEQPEAPRQLRVLVVDDESHNGEAVRRAFKKAPNVVVESSSSGEAGLQALASKPFDLLLVDYSMAGLSGIEFVERARKIAPYGLYVMLTAYPELKQVLDAQARGLLDGILAKPWNLQELDLVMKQARTMIHLREIRERVTRIK